MKNISSKVTVSIVSHGHGAMVWRLVSQITSYSDVVKIIVTLNVSEFVPENLSKKVFVIKNNKPKGFGENHNTAFDLVDSEFYCVLNPDIEFVENPFPALINIFYNKECGVVAPVIINRDGVAEDSMRKDLTPSLLMKRIFGLNRGIYISNRLDSKVLPDWVGGMFMLFRTEAFEKVGRFDRRYFMYCEDADICRRMWKIGYCVFGCLEVNVVHSAQRASHRNLKHLIWHLQSLLRYFFYSH